MNKTWFIFKDKLHSIEPKMELDMEITPQLLMMVADVDYAVKRDLWMLGHGTKEELDKEYGSDPPYLPIIISEEEAQEIIARFEGGERPVNLQEWKHRGSTPKVKT